MGRGAEPSSEDAEELAIVRRSLTDGSAFATLYERYLDPIYRHCYRSVGNRAEAEDATSAIFHKAFERRAACTDGSFRAWLFTIASNHMRDVARSRRPVIALTSWDPDPGQEVGERVLASLEHDRLHAVLQRLDPDVRQVFELRLDGFQHAEIARLLDRSHDWVRQAHSRGKKTLRPLLGIDPGEEGRA